MYEHEYAIDDNGQRTCPHSWVEPATMGSMSRFLRNGITAGGATTIEKKKRPDDGDR